MCLNDVLTEEKAELRKKFGRLRASIPQKERKLCSLKIQAKLQEERQYRTGGAIFTYVSKGDEVETGKLISAAWAEGRRVAVPRCLNTDGKMAFYWIKDWNDLTPGRFGVMEPTILCPPAQAGEKDICIVPAFSFDISGYRLGYGKGYYDRFLSGFPGISVGFCFEACITRRLPKDFIDRPVNAVITDQCIREI